ncbi:MAG: domain containing protein [Cyanobacteria bacterium RYN_339]|nr:domain containing protein [Cyanobacteria bacterium RYN_339]
MWKFLLIAAVATLPPKMELDKARPLADQQGFLDELHARQAWQTTRGRPDVVVAVLDGGVDDTHPDLKGQVLQGPNFTSFAGGGLDISGQGHGTHIAGVIAANGKVSGVAPGVRVLALRVEVPEYENGAFTGIAPEPHAMARAIRYAAFEGHARVINYSGGVPADPEVRAATAEAMRAGVLFCVSAGNAGRDSYAQDTPNLDMTCALVVHGLDHQDQLAGFSNYGDPRGICAPALDLLSTMPLSPNPFNGEGRSRYGRYGIHTGTSSATPCTAGVAALVYSALADARHVSPTAIAGLEVAKILRTTARHLGDTGPNPRYGVGAVDAAAAVAACKR